MRNSRTFANQVVFRLESESCPAEPTYKVIYVDVGLVLGNLTLADSSVDVDLLILIGFKIELLKGPIKLLQP